MPRVFISSVVAVLVVASACGGDDDLADPARIEVGVAVSGPDSGDGDQTATQGDAGTPDVEGIDAAVSTEGAAQPTTAVVVGDRFEWCAPVREAWDSYTEASAAVARAAETLSGAVGAHAAATDELDRAEAAAAVQDAQAAYDEARGTADSVAWWAIGPLLESAASSSGSTDDTLGIAYGRAWEAFAAAATPAEVAFAQLPERNWVQHELPGLADSEAQALFREADWHWARLSPQGSVIPLEAMATTTVREPADELDLEQLEARFGLSDMDWVRYISPEEVQALGEDRISEAAAAASDAAALFGAMTVSFSDEALSALTRLQDSSAAVHDARDAGPASNAAEVLVTAYGAVREIAVTTLASYTAASMAFGAAEATRHLVEHADTAGFASVDSRLVDDAATAAASADASLSSLEAVELDWRNWTTLALRALDPLFDVAFDTVLSHSTAHAAFAQSLSESCR